MSMEWSYNVPEITQLCRDVLSNWTRQQLLDALIQCEIDDFIKSCDKYPSIEDVERFENSKYSQWQSDRDGRFAFPDDFLAERIWDCAEKNRTCSNDFSEIFIDKNGFHRIALP